MRITILASFALIFSLLTSASYGQLDGVYEFDGGGDGTSWNDADNWEVITLPDGTPSSGNPATPPDPVTTADIPLAGAVIDGTMPGQTALDVNVGTANGAGSLAISGGDLTVRDFFVGSDGGGANAGMLNISGGTLFVGDDITLGNGSMGTLTMSGGLIDMVTPLGDDFFINGGSSASVTGGTIHIRDRLVMAGDASLVVDGGTVLADDDFFFFEDSQVTVNSGLMEVVDKLRFDDDEAFGGKLTINGGIVRSNEFGLEIDGLLTDFRGVVEINGDGVFQVQLPTSSSSPISQLSVETAVALINEGVHLTTSEPAPLHLGATVVIIPEFAGEFDVPFVQISVVPEPSTALLLGLGLVGLVMRRNRS